MKQNKDPLLFYTAEKCRRLQGTADSTKRSVVLLRLGRDELISLRRLLYDSGYNGMCDEDDNTNKP